MTDERPADDTAASVAGLRDELRTLVNLRWELARLEIAEARQAARRFVYAAIPCAMMAAAVVPLVAVAAAERLAGVARLGKLGWLVVFAAALAALATGLGWWAWRRFRRDFNGLAQTREELREDLAWLREWLGSR